MRPDELHNPMEVKKRELFDKLIEKKWGTATTIYKADNQKSEDESESWKAYEDEFEKPRNFSECEDIVDHNGKLLSQ